MKKHTLLGFLLGLAVFAIAAFQGAPGLTVGQGDQRYAPKAAYWDLLDPGSARYAWTPAKPRAINATALSLASTARPAVPSGTILYVSNSASNGFSVGNDTNTFAQVQSKSTPALSIGRAVILAAANSLSGSYRVIVNDGTYAENDFNRFIPKSVFSNYIRIESRTGRAADVVMTNNTASSSSPIQPTTGSKWSNYWFHGITIRAIGTAYNAIQLPTTHTDTTSLGSNLWLTDCIVEGQQAPNGSNAAVINITGTAAFNGFYMDGVKIKCSTTPSAALGGIWAFFLSGGSAKYQNWMFRNVDWDGLACGGGSGLRNLDGFAIVGCKAVSGFALAGGTDYGLIIGNDDTTQAQGVTNGYIKGGNFGSTGNGGHGLLIGGASNIVVDTVNVSGSGAATQGFVVKSSTDVDVWRSTIRTTGSSILNAAYDKGSTRCWWFDNVISSTYGVAFRQADNPAISSVVSGVFIGNSVTVPGTDGSNVLVNIGSPTVVAVPSPSIDLGNTYGSPVASRGSIRGTTIGSSADTRAAFQAAWLTAGLPGENYNSAR